MLKDHPNANELRFLLAELLQEQGKSAQAEAMWLKISRGLPNDLTSRFGLFECALQANQFDTARALLSELRDLEGEDGKYGQLAVRRNS